MNNIGIMGALPEEVRRIVDVMTNVSPVELAGVVFYCGEYAQHRLVVCCAGMGKANAAAVTQILITKFCVDSIIFSGIAGNMSDKIGIGDVVIGETLCYHDAEDRMLAQSAPFTALYRANPALVALAVAACTQLGVRHLVGKIATGDQFIGDAAAKKDILQRCRPDCVEMEGAAVAQTCMRNNLPFVVVRSMSDNSDTSIEFLGAEAFDVSTYVATSSAIVLAMVENDKKLPNKEAEIK